MPNPQHRSHRHHHQHRSGEPGRASDALHPRKAMIVTYVLAPLVLSPLLWPFLVILVVYLMAFVGGKLIFAAADGVVFIATLLTQNRGALERSRAWAVQVLGWSAMVYWSQLCGLHRVCEDVIGAFYEAFAPFILEFLRRSPLLARILRPFVMVFLQAQQGIVGLYCFLHDWVVPVALDFVERMPLLQSMLLDFAGSPAQQAAKQRGNRQWQHQDGGQGYGSQH